MSIHQQAFSQGKPFSNLGAQTDLVYHADFEILGTELVGNRKEFGVDPLVLLDVPFDWQPTYYYLYNGEGSTGRPSGQWQFQQFTDNGDGLNLTWREATKPRDIGPDFAAGNFQRLVKPHMDYRMQVCWMSSTKDQGIRFSVVCTSPPTLGAAKLQIGLAGNIMFY